MQIWEKDYPQGVTWEQEFRPTGLPEYFDETVARWGDHPCLDFMDKTYSYREVGALVAKAAKGFQDLGVGPGVHVGLFLPNCPQYVIAFFGILKAGGRVVNYSPLDAERELLHKIEDSRTDIMVTLHLNVLYPRMAAMLGKTRLRKLIVGKMQDVLPFPKNLLFPLVKGKDIAKVPVDDSHLWFSDLLDNDGRYTPHPVADPVEEVALLQYTGGTTGLPKGAMLTHANITVAVQILALWTGAGDEPFLKDGEERTLVVLPMFHIYGLSAVMLRAFGSGSLMVLHPRFELEAVLKDVEKKKITVLPGVPTMFAAINGALDSGKYDLSTLKFCGSGGAPLPVETKLKFEKLTGGVLSEGWGMTETSPVGTSQPLAKSGKPGSCGVPLPGILIEITDIDDPMKLLPQGERGEICITGPNIMKGYWNKPEATEEAFKGGRFHTGDVGYMDEDGYIFIVDRMKDMILSRRLQRLSAQHRGGDLRASRCRRMHRDRHPRRVSRPVRQGLPQAAGGGRRHQHRAAADLPEGQAGQARNADPAGDPRGAPQDPDRQAVEEGTGGRGTAEIRGLPAQGRDRRLRRRPGGPPPGAQLAHNISALPRPAGRHEEESARWDRRTSISIAASATWPCGPCAAIRTASRWTIWTGNGPTGRWRSGSRRSSRP